MTTAHAHVGWRQPLDEATTSKPARVSDRMTGYRARIPPENAKRIFYLYFTTKGPVADPAPAQPSGSGIGLYSCDQIVRAYGGEIRVASKDGQGACFTIRIPWQQETATPADADRRAGVPRPASLAQAPF